MFGKPVIVMETGYHTISPKHNYGRQAEYIRIVCKAAKRAGAEAIFIYDILANNPSSRYSQDVVDRIKCRNGPGGDEIGWEGLGYFEPFEDYPSLFEVLKMCQ